jgi:hypothetical protein
MSARLKAPLLVLTVVVAAALFWAKSLVGSATTKDNGVSAVVTREQSSGEYVNLSDKQASKLKILSV